jgi:hypothetical protein
MKKTFLIAFIGIFLVSCGQQKRKVDLTGVDFEVKIQRFDRDFWEMKDKNYAQELPKLYEKYPDFAPLFFEGIWGVGSNFDTIANYFLPYFFSESVGCKIYSDALKTFDNTKNIDKKLTNAFRRGHAFFPELPIPQCYFYISGFRQSVAVADGLIAVSTDRYLGADYPFYSEIVGDQFNIYEYMFCKMTPENIAPDVLFAWLSTEFEPILLQDRLLDEMIYYGKIYYIISLLMPSEPENNIIGYTKNQWKWCKDNEHGMWLSLIQEKHLFSTEHFLRIKYMNDAPFTEPFTQESPGRAGIFVGWQIVESYMKTNPKITPLELMQNADAQAILENSGYNP